MNIFISHISEEASIAEVLKDWIESTFWVSPRSSQVAIPMTSLLETSGLMKLIKLWTQQWRFLSFAVRLL